MAHAPKEPDLNQDFSSSSSRAGVATGYRAVLRLPDHEDAIAVAEREVRSWLTAKLKSSKRVDEWVGPGTFQLRPKLTISEVWSDDVRSGIRFRLYRVRDINSGGDFEIRVIGMSSPKAAIGQRETLVVEGGVSGETPEQAVDSVATPRLVRDLLEQYEVRDGDVRLRGTPQLVRSGDIDEVVRSILDPQRSGAVIVASSVDRETDARWHRIVESLTTNSVGVASVFVVSADAQVELEERLPPSHAVPRGRVRTFVPKVDFSDSTDGWRHRFLGPETLARSIRGSKVGGYLPKVHARGPRRQLLESSLPSDVRRAVALLRRAETDARRAEEVRRRVQPGERVSKAPASFGTEILAIVRDVVRKWLKTDKVGPEELAELDNLIATKDAEVKVALEQMDEVAEQIDSLASQIVEARNDLDEKDLELAIEAERARDLERENLFLRQGLKDVQRFDLLSVPADVKWASPDTVGELALRLSPDGETSWAWLRERVVFTGDLSRASEVEKRDPHGRYAKDLWDYVRVLFEYSEAKSNQGFRGNVHMYLSDETDGFKCSPQRHAAGESGTVENNAEWRSQRIFPVPASIDSTGSTYMGAHFKPTHRDTFAPRMYYLDDVDATGRSYIGYVGPHLKNTKS